MAGNPPVSVQVSTPQWKLWHTLSLLVIITGIALLCLLLPLDMRLWSWLGSMVLLTAFLAIAGQGVTGDWRAVLIDGRNKMSLSRLQMALWTLIILSAFLASAMVNMRNGQVDPLAIAIPAGIWILLGISATSLIGSPLILSNKKSQEPDPEEATRNLDLLKHQDLPQPDAVAAQGKVVVNTSPANARFADLFTGEEVGNAAQLDLGKIQLFYFTFILAFVYAVALGTLFLGPVKAVNAFPDVNVGVLTILGISHAAYLTNKAIPHSQS
jgi:hypothetical protein